MARDGSRVDPDLPKISICMAVLNEGLDFETTVAMAASSKPRPFEIVVADDCSLEPVRSRLEPWAARDDLLIKYIRTPRRMGSGFCKHLALEHAEGDLRVVVDSHMRFPWDWLERLLSEHRNHPDAILCPVSHGFGYPGRQFVGRGCDFHLSEELGFWEAKWRVVPTSESAAIPCVMGGAYAIPVHVLEAIGGYAPGLLGFGSEEDTSRCAHGSADSASASLPMSKPSISTTVKWTAGAPMVAPASSRGKPPSTVTSRP